MDTSSHMRQNWLKAGVSSSEQQTLQEWLRRENEWQKNRAKASSKSKGAK